MEDRKKIKGKSFLEDVEFEGKDEVQLDVDRFINEGMSGGSVHKREEATNIEEDLPMPEEEPPHKAEG